MILNQTNFSIRHPPATLHLRIKLRRTGVPAN